MKGTIIRLFVILLGLSHLLSLRAVPVTRTESLMQGPQVHHLALENIHKDKDITERNWEEPSVTERMALELNDYPPSGANGRHTPKPPYP